MKRRNPVGASQNRAIAIGSPDKLGYGAKLNAAGTEGGLLSSLVHIPSPSKIYQAFRIKPKDPF